MAATAVIGGGALIGGALSYAGSQNAANAETGAANQANQTQLGIFNTEQQNAAPYLASGTAALGTLNSEMSSLQSPFTMQDFQQSPGYQFQLNQGEGAMQRSAAASGMLDSVGTQQNLNNYAQGAANTDYQTALTNYTNQQQQRYNMLSGVANMGLSATGLTNSAAANAGNNISANTIGAGNATAAASVGGANAINGALSTGVNGYTNANMMSHLFGNTNPGNLNGQLLGSTQGANSAMAGNMPSLQMPSLLTD